MRLERKLYFATKRSRSKWTAFGQSERSTEVKLKGQKAESGWPSIKLDSPKDKTWTVQRDGTEHYIKDDGRPKRPKVDIRKTRCGPKDSKWTFQETNTDGSEIKNERPEEPE